MADEWIKWTKGLANKREIVVLASKLARDRHEIAGRLMALWEWCDDNVATGADGNGCPDFVPHASVYLGANSRAFIDEKVGIIGCADALASPEIGWIVFEADGRVTFQNFERHNGSTAKARALDARKKRRQRAAKVAARPDFVPQRAGPEERREETRGEFPSSQKSMGERKTIGRATKSGVAPENLSSPSPRSPKSARRREEDPEPFDLSDWSESQWQHVVAMAEQVARKIPARTEEDRRAWLRYAVLAESSFSEAWLIDAAEAVVNAVERKGPPQAHFVAVLKSKASEDSGVTEKDFNAMAKRVEIPTSIWKSKCVPIVGPSRVKS